MAIKRENKSNLILDDLDNRNDNWNELEQRLDDTYTKDESDNRYAEAVHTHVIADVIGLNQELSNLQEQIDNEKDLFRFDKDLNEYVNVDKFWKYLRNGKVYTTEFYNFDITPNPQGVKKDANAGLEIIPSTATEANRDDYDDIGLFKSIDVNAYVDENDDYHITAIKGDDRFKADGTNGDVYVMSMVGYQKLFKTDTTWGVSYSDTELSGFKPLQGAVKVDGTIRSFLLHAKYVAGVNPLDEQLGSISGVPADIVMSHNHQITKFKAKGTQYSGKTSHDDYYVQLMFWLKYATTHSQSVMYGATSTYFLQYTNTEIETDVNRVILTNAQANNLLLGSTVSIGEHGTETITNSRTNALNMNLANRVLITEIEDLGNGKSAVYVDADNFDTTLNTTITVYPYNTGYCDSVLGRDGSPVNPLSGKEPFIINGIEMMIGGYEIIQNLIIQNNAVDNRIDVYANYDCAKYATSITSDYKLVGQIASTNNTWSYISKIEIKEDHPSIILPVETEANSSTGIADGLYSNPPSAGGTRGWLSLGGLDNGAFSGLRALNANGLLGYSSWGVLGRLSATGRSRGELM